MFLFRLCKSDTILNTAVSLFPSKNYIESNGAKLELESTGDTLNMYDTEVDSILENAAARTIQEYFYKKIQRKSMFYDRILIRRLEMERM